MIAVGRTYSPREHALEVARARKTTTARSELVEHDSEREHVGTEVDLFTEGLLGRHVARLAAHDARVRVVLRDARDRDAEVDHFDVAGMRDHHIRERDVAMDEA